jgi:hypothetical protein
LWNIAANFIANCYDCLLNIFYTFYTDKYQSSEDLKIFLNISSNRSTPLDEKFFFFWRCMNLTVYSWAIKNVTLQRKLKTIHPVHTVYLCFASCSEYMAIIFLKITNHILFIMEMDCIICEAPTDVWYVRQMKLILPETETIKLRALTILSRMLEKVYYQYILRCVSVNERYCTQ